MSIREEIQKAIAEAVSELGLKPEEILIDHPSDFTMGDLTTNVAMMKAKALGANPRELAEKIKSALEGKIADVEKIDVAGPGFINFHLSKDFFNKKIEEVLSDPQFGANEMLKGRKVMLEYTDPNPFKQFHIGHLMSNAIGESLSRLYEWSGAEVKRANYEGDTGLHVAKAIWGIRKKMSEKPVDDAPLSEQVAFLGNAYTFGSNSYEDDAAAKAEIDELNRVIFLKADPELNALWEWGKKVSLDHFEEIYAKLGTKFDYYFFEDKVANRGLEIVNEGLAKGIFEKSDGAVVFRGENHGLHTRVFINSKGLPTYEAKELALAEKKNETYSFDESISITASEQNDYFRVVLKALELINPELRAKIRHISHGMLRFASGKMSSRKGNVITGESLIAAMQEMVYDKMKDRPMANDEKNEISEEVGVAAIKYSILKQAPGRDIIYDFDKSLSFDGDSGPYLQYATVRARSVLDKARQEGIAASVERPDDEVAEVAKLVSRFPDVVLRAERELMPSYLVTYLIELAANFNSYYADHKIVDAKDAHSPYRVALTSAFTRVMENGLYLLGMKVPVKM
ncbi:MAG TPA: arginine--tRNA ligase [Candidatus Paceibacterota bacterium]|nr:arginine--tRNA ligase [Candidatus Paceibacterota bacterium]